MSSFLAIAIAILYPDHDPPHFHATYGEFEITVTIRDGVVTGRFPRRALAHAGMARTSWGRAPGRLGVGARWTAFTPDRALGIGPEHLAMVSSDQRYVMMNVTAVRYVRAHVLWLQFSDGAEGEVDLARELVGEIFAPLQDAAYFAQVRLDPEIRTIAWPNGADFAPEFLRELLRSRVAA